MDDNTSPTATVSTHGQILTLAGVTSGTTRTQLLEAWRDHTGTVEEFWTSVTGGLVTPTEADRIQFGLRLQALTRHSKKLEDDLFAAHGASAQISDLVVHEPSDWLMMASATDRMPADLAAANVPVADYAAQMHLEVESAFPTEMLADRQSKSWFAGSVLPAGFFSSGAGAGYELNGLPADQFLGALAENDPQRLEVRRHERLYHLSPPGSRFEVTRALWTDDIESAVEITRLGRSRFLSLPNVALLDTEVAERTFARAQAAASTAITLQMRHDTSLPRAGFAALPPSGLGSANKTVFPLGEGEQGLDETGSGQLSYTALFGGRTFCACSHCQSSHGAPAYLADLMFWLAGRSAPTLPSTSFLDLLKTRRADLGTLKLSCRNANTPLPTIDLLLERLEAEWEPNNAPTAPQTSLDAEELAARPEHVHHDAYDKLAGVGESTYAYFPFEAPYNFWLDRVRTFLGALGIERASLLAAFVDGGVVSALQESEFCAELLGISQVSWALLANSANPTSEDVAWGYTSGAIAAVSVIRELLTRIGPQSDEDPAPYELVEDLLRCKYVQHRDSSVGTVKVVFYNPDCNIDGSLGQEFPSYGPAKLVFDATHEPEHLKRMARLVRLARHTGWSFRDCDRAIEVFRASSPPSPLQQSDISEALLKHLAGVALLARERGRPIAEVLDWFGPLDTRRWEHRLKDDDGGGIPAAQRHRIPDFDSANAGGEDAVRSPYQERLRFQDTGVESRAISGGGSRGDPRGGVALVSEWPSGAGSRDGWTSAGRACRGRFRTAVGLTGRG